jgi:hypothetical protein
MTFYKRWLTGTVLLALTATSAGVSAQDKQTVKSEKGQTKVQSDVITQRNGVYTIRTSDSSDVAPQRVWVAGDGNAMFISTEMMSSGNAVKGAPYSAQTVTESVQTLADGNRIVHKNSSTIYRDSEGRTRREQTVGEIGPYATMNEPSQIIMINDPVGSAHYVLDPRSKTARKLGFIMPDMASPDGKAMRNVTIRVDPMAKDHAAAEMAAKVQAETAAADSVRIAVPPMPPLRPGLAVASGDVATFTFKTSNHEPKHEDLGKQTIEGVEAEGHRETVTIPAGEIGNEQPIQIVSESWYSPELQVIVMSRHSDPQIGETVYRLTNINRTEPAHSLFELPSDYAVKDVIDQKIKMKLDRQMQNERDTQRTRKPADNQDN